MHTRLMAGVWLVVAWAGAASAQVLDLQTGRAADLHNEAQASVEAGLATGDADYFGARGNFRVAEPLLVGVDLGVADFEDRELAGGLFALFQLDLRAPVAVAVKVGYDATLTGDGDASDFSAEGLVSGPIAKGLQWYANGGLHFVQVESARTDVVYVMPARRSRHHMRDREDDLAPGLGAGLTFAFDKNASAFVGADMLLGDLYDDNVIGAGFRWSFD